VVELMVQNWNQLLTKFIFLHKDLKDNIYNMEFERRVTII